jgi:hypothetical protein
MEQRDACRTATGLAVALTAATAVLVVLTPAGLPARPTELPGYLATREPADAVTAALALAGWAVLGWLAVGGLAVAGSALPGLAGAACSSLAGRITPVALRRTVELLVGVGVATAGTTGQLAAVATTGPPHAAAAAAHFPARAAGGAVRLQPCLDRPPAPPGFSPAPPQRPAVPTSLDRPGGRDSDSGPGRRGAIGPDTATVVVRPGDSLWAIAARHLGPSPPDAAIAVSWPRWYQRNRTVVGADPDLLRPGQRLVAPTDPVMRSEEHP